MRLEDLDFPRIGKQHLTWDQIRRVEGVYRRIEPNEIQNDHIRFITLSTQSATSTSTSYVLLANMKYKTLIPAEVQVWGRGKFVRTSEALRLYIGEN